MIRILHTESSKGWGGQEIRIIQEAFGIRKRGYEVIIAAEKDSQILKKASELNFEIFPISFSKYNPQSFLKIKSLIEKLGIQIVNTHSSKDSWISTIAAKIISKKKIKVIRTRHLSTLIKKNFLNKILYDILTDSIITTGEQIKNRMINENKFNEKKIISIPTGVDIEKFNPDRFQLNKKKNEFSVGAVGVLRSWKGHNYLIDAIPSIIREIPNIKIYIVGDGPQRENLEKKIRTLNVEKWVKITGHREDIPDLLASLDVVIHPSYANEGVPQVVLQALAMEKAVIASDIACINEVVINNKTGILIKPKNVEAISNSILSLYKDKNLRKELGEKGRRFVVENYSYEKMLDKLETLYEKLLSN